MKKIYLAIPYSKIDMVSSFNQANEATIKLLEQGYNVYSPITHSHVLTYERKELPHTWDFWEKIDKQFIDWADEVWVLVPEEGYFYVANSTGVQAELKYAEETKKVVRFIESRNGALQNYQTSILDFETYGEDLRKK